jgi:hypothetical protein
MENNDVTQEEQAMGILQHLDYRYGDDSLP